MKTAFLAGFDPMVNVPFFPASKSRKSKGLDRSFGVIGEMNGGPCRDFPGNSCRVNVVLVVPGAQ